MQPSLVRIKRSYFLITAITWFSVAIPLPIFVLYMQARGIDLFQLGIIMGLYSLVIVLLELPTGGLADAIGRKTVALLANGFALVSGVVMFISFSFWGFLLAMLLNGIGRALSSGALDAWYVDSLQEAEPDVDLQPALAQAGTVALLSLGLGTLAGGFLPQIFSWLPEEGSALFSPMSTTIILSTTLRIILIVVILLAVQEQSRRTTEAGGWRALYEVPQVVGEALQLSKTNSTLLYLMLITLVGGFALSGVETFWQPRFAEIIEGGQSSSGIFGVIMAISFLAGVAGNLLSIPLSKRLGKRYTLVATLARGGQGLGLLLLALGGYLIPAAFSFWFFYLNMGLQNSPHDTLVNEEIPAERRSTILSVQSLASYIGGFLGSVLLGFIAQQNTISTAWLVAAALTMVSLLLYRGVSKHRKQRDQTNAQEVPILDHS
jgi:MFS family permease